MGKDVKGSDMGACSVAISRRLFGVTDQNHAKHQSSVPAERSPLFQFDASRGPRVFVKCTAVMWRHLSDKIMLLRILYETIINRLLLQYSDRSGEDYITRTFMDGTSRQILG